MQRDAKNILIAASSGRALAASARRAGYISYIIDLFEDFDTVAMSAATKNACAKNTLRFDKIKLQQAIDSFAAIDFHAIVFGAGFEQDTALLDVLNTQNNLFGNSPELIESLKQPATFFGLLDHLDIPFARVRVNVPLDADGWLAKTIAATGGAHVQAAQAVAASDDIYFQRFEEGRNLSMLFLANGKKAQLVGFNEQLTQAVGDARYCYSGAINHAELPDEMKNQIARKLAALVETTGLVGLNSVDFILRDDKYFVLEINPRLSATVELYDQDFPRGLLHAHMRACEGELPESMPAEKNIRGHKIVWAQQNTKLPATFKFPAWCADIPQPGSFIAKDAPLCSVLVNGPSHAAVLAQLEKRSAEIQSQLLEQAA
ncbi:MAG: ATP-grasp domain-containing protein [Burkholderiales bacterium]